MPRPIRVLKDTKTNRLYFLKGGKKVYIKDKHHLSQKQVQKISIRNIINNAPTRRLKRRVTKKKLAVVKNLAGATSLTPMANLPVYSLNPRAEEKYEADKKRIGYVEAELKLLRDTYEGKKQDTRGTQTTGETFTERNRSPRTPFRETIPKPQDTPSSVIDDYVSKHQSVIDTYNTGDKKNDALYKLYKDWLKKVEKSDLYLEPEPFFRELIRLGYIDNETYTRKKTQRKEDRKKNEGARSGIKEGDVSDDEIKGAGSSKDDGLYDDELQTLASKKLKGQFVPIISSDEGSKLKSYYHSGDFFPFIVNTVPSRYDGSGKDGGGLGHWCAVVVDSRDDMPTIEFYDPLAENTMNKSLLKSVKEITKMMNPEVMFKFKENKISRQSKSTSTCGFHSLKFLDDRFRGKTFSEASGYDEFIERLRKKGEINDSKDGEADINRYKRSFKNYV